MLKMALGLKFAGIIQPSVGTMISISSISLTHLASFLCYKLIQVILNSSPFVRYLRLRMIDTNRALSCHAKHYFPLTSWPIFVSLFEAENDRHQPYSLMTCQTLLLTDKLTNIFLQLMTYILKHLKLLRDFLSIVVSTRFTLLVTI